MAEAPAFNEWMYSTIAPFTKGEILEIGSGIGNISALFIHQNKFITLSDIDDFYIQFLKKKFHQSSKVKDFLSIDLQSKDFKNHYRHLERKYDTVFLLNVLEHLEDDSSAIENCKYLLKKNGTLIILVPAYSFLFSEMDKALNHFRRYSLNQFSRLIQKENFKIENSFYFNAMGIAAWLYGKSKKYKSPPNSNMKFYNKLVPLGKLIDKIFFNKIGLSAIVVANNHEPLT
jgi:2-polyprenyl-3-methyl-5-hydroxy-6-metoxy-1,4-benzoquinol methylase